MPVLPDPPPGTKRSSLPTWRVTAGAYASMGLVAELDLECLPEGYAYINGRAALAGDPYDCHDLALHDLAHYLVAPASRKMAPNFGLGPHPTVDEPNRSLQKVTDGVQGREEGTACVLTVLLSLAVFGEVSSDSVARILSTDNWSRLRNDLGRVANNQISFLTLYKLKLLVPGTCQLSLPPPLHAYVKANGKGPLKACLGP